MNDIAKGVVGSLIASALIALGAYLSIAFVPEQTVLNYKVVQNRTSELSFWYLSLKNGSTIPFDSVKLTEPKDSLLAVSYSIPSKTPSNVGWEGKLSKGEELNVLYFFSSGTVFSESVLNDLIEASYQERNETSGDWEQRALDLSLGESSSVARTSLKIFLFLLPFIVVSALSFIGLYFYRKRHAGQSE